MYDVKEYKFSKCDCWFRNNCSNYDTENCHSGCKIYFQYYYLVNLANIPKYLQQPANQVLQPGKDIKEYKYLESIKENIVDWVYQGRNLYLYSDTCGNGKAQPLYSKIATPNGFTLMGDINVGDQVITQDGTFTKVTGVFPQGKKDVYEITFSDGSKCRCSDEHLWYVKYKGKYLTMTLNEIIDKPLYTQYKSGKSWWFKVPMVEPVQYKEKNLKINPYVLGVLIGDGNLTNNTPQISNTENDIIDKVSHLLKETHKLVAINDKDYRVVDISSCSRNTGHYRHNRLTDDLRYLGLYKHTAYDKFIPQEYLYSSIEQRTQLLQGLIDTDGYVTNKGGFVEYVTSSHQLALDVQQLVNSLGGTCTLKEFTPKYTYKGVKKQGHLAYRLGIKLPDEIIPFTSEKHLSRFVPNSRQRKPYRNIIDIRYIGKEECQCIMVDSPSHLYLTDNYIVTHNTTWAVKLMSKYFSKIWNKNGTKCRGLFINVDDFLMQYKSNINKKDKRFEEMVELIPTVDLIIWDDIGCTKLKDYDHSILFPLINSRLINGKANIYTSNVIDDDLDNNIGARLRSRILDVSDVVEFINDSQRKPKEE